MNINPRRLFIIDGLGALLSAFLLGIVLVRFENLIGMPRNTLYILAAIPCFFVLYDFICYWRMNENWRPYLKIIAIANLVYCCISIGFLVHHYQKLTNLGFIYFLLELVIVFVLVIIELKTVAKAKTNTT